MKASDFGASRASGLWCYSADGQTFHGDFATREEAVAEARDMRPGEVVWVGRAADAEVDPVDGWQIVERLGETANESCGDVADDYPSGVTNEQVQELESAVEKVVGEWLTRHGHWPAFHAVEGVERVEPEAEEPT